MITLNDARAIIDMETRTRDHRERARALQLCILQLSRDAAELGLDATYRTLKAAAEAIDMEARGAH